MTDPTPAPRPAAHDRVNAALARVLTVSIMLAAAIALVGVTMHLSRHGAERPAYATYAPAEEALRAPAAILAKAMAADGRAIIQLGVLVLVVTPVLRVAFALVGFALERDRLYVALSAVVLAVLALGLIGVLD